MASQQEVLRTRVLRFKETHTKKETADHFIDEGVPRSTIYSIISNYEKTGTIKRKPGSGRPPRIMTNYRKAGLRRKSNNKADISSKQIAREYGCDDSYVRSTIRSMGIRCYRKRPAPYYTDEQQEMVKKQARWMYDTYSKVDLILDDEKYFGLSGPENGTYRTDDKSTCPDDVKHKPRKKYEQKLLVYMAASSKGISKPFIAPSGIAINGNTYVNECLEGVLVPFIRQYYADGDFVFWPDKASSHYSAVAIECLRRNNIPFVPKEHNPTNLPQCRPIEDLWGVLVDFVYANGWTATSLYQLKRRILKAIARLDETAVKHSFSHIRKELGKVYRNGPLSKAH